MNSEYYEVSLADYLMVLWKEKWIIIVTFAVAVAAATLLVARTPAQYQVETSLFILPPLAQDITGTVVGTVYAPDTYKRLATAGDLLQEVSRRAYPDGEGPSPSRLRERMTVEVDQTTARDFPGRFPLYVTVRFRGSARDELVRIASTWADVFIERNAELFLTRTAQSFSYISDSFAEVEADLRAKQDELRTLRQQGQLEVLEAELTALETVYAQYVQDLSLEERELAQWQAQLSVLESYLEQPVRHALARGNLSSDYVAFAQDLAHRTRELNQEQARLASLEETLAAEPEFYALTRAVSPEALWQYLGAGTRAPTAADLERFLGLGVEDQELNTAYVELRRQIASTRSAIEVLEADKAHLEAQTQALWQLLEAEDVPPEIATGTVSEALARAEYELRGEIAVAQTRVQEIEAHVGALRAQVQATKVRIEEIRSQLIALEEGTQRLSQEIRVLERSYERMSDKLQDARLARAEDAEPIRVVEQPVRPTQAIGPRRTMNVAVAGVLGLFVGVLLAFVAHAIKSRDPDFAPEQGKKDGSDALDRDVPHKPTDGPSGR